MTALEDVLEELTIKNAADTTLLYMDKRVTDSMTELINNATNEYTRMSAVVEAAMALVKDPPNCKPGCNCAIDDLIRACDAYEETK